MILTQISVLKTLADQQMWEIFQIFQNPPPLMLEALYLQNVRNISETENVSWTLHTLRNKVSSVIGRDDSWPAMVTSVVWWNQS